MKQSKIITKYATVGVLATVALAPGPLLAGGYGDTAVRDASVGQSAGAEDTVWCGRLRQEIPLSLEAQMNCGPGTPPRADKGQGFFETLFSNLRPSTSGRPRRDDDDDNRQRTRVSSVDDTNDDTLSSVSKWERLGELNVTPDNLADQSPEFQEKLGDYLSRNGAGGDWSDFNPD